MRTGKHGARRIVALACSLALCASMLPTAVFATEPTADVTDVPETAATQPVENEQPGVVETPVQGETDSTPASQPESESAEMKDETAIPAEPAEDTEQPAEGEGTTESVEEPTFDEEPVEEVQPLGESVQLDSKPAAASNVIGGTTKKVRTKFFL